MIGLNLSKPIRELIDLNDLPDPGDSDSKEIIYNPKKRETEEGSISPSKDSNSESESDNHFGRGTPANQEIPPFK